LTLVTKSTDLNAEGKAIKRDPSKFSESHAGIWANFTKTVDSRVPWSVDNIPAQRNWKGEVVASSGGGFMYETFPMKWSDAKNDPATEALLNNWVAPQIPGQVQTIPVPPEIAARYLVTEMSIDLLDLDENKGYVLSTFHEYVGRARNALVTEYIQSDKYKQLMEDGGGNKSKASIALEVVLETGTQAGKLQFLRDYSKLAKQHGWMEFGGPEMIRLLEARAGEEQKQFPMPAPATRNIPEF